MEDLERRLKDKAIEAFLLAIEIYNKQTIKYRVEGFSFFIINAWELLLKSYIIRRDGNKAIYYKDNPGRTLSLENCIKKVFTNEKDPLRINLERIIELRNTSTHFITPEYESLYLPLFQANVDNFSDKLHDLLNEELVQYVSESFLRLPTSVCTIQPEQIRAKYTDAVSARFIELNNKISEQQGKLGSRFAISIVHTYKITKKDGADVEKIRISKDGEPAKIIDRPKDFSSTHPYTANKAIEKLNALLRRSSVEVYFRGNRTTLNKSHLTNLNRSYGVKNNQDFCYTNTLYKNPQYSYSQALIDILYEELRKHPKDLLDRVADEYKLAQSKKKGR